MGRNNTNNHQSEPANSKRRRTTDEIINEEEEAISQKALIHLIRKVGGLLVPTAVRRDDKKGETRWIIEVTLRYPTGHEGYVGDLLYDGEKFSILTPQRTWKKRINQIANDPEGRRKWDEFRASTFSADET